MQIVKIGLFVILLLGIIFIVVRDHNAKNDDDTQNIIQIQNTKTQPLIEDKYQWSVYSPELPLPSHYHSPEPDIKEGMSGNIFSGKNNNSGSGGSGGSGGGDSGCSTCTSVGGGTGKLLPVMDPMYNMREICKQCVLLEDHLFQKKKRCRDCCIKHQLTIEALAEEAITLDKDGKCRDLYDLPDKIRVLQKDFIANRDPNEIAQEYRKVRKSLMQRCFNNF